MADIAAQAGFSKGTPYLYFPSKEALFIALHEEWDCQLTIRVDAAISALPEDGRRSPRQILEIVAAAVAEHVLEQTHTCRVLMEARALAAHEPAIAAVVRAADATSHEQLEALGMSAMLGRPVSITAGEPGTDRIVTVSVNGDQARWRPRRAVVFAGTTAGDTCHAADRSCGYINFFTSAQAARRWARANPAVTGEVLRRAAALTSGITEFGAFMRTDDRVRQPDRI
jgi:AcrR family transcriptional regulator